MSESEMHNLETIATILSIIMAVLGIGFWVAWSQYNGRRWRYAVAPVVWLTHTALYFVIRLIEPEWMTVDVRATWKLAIVIQGIISLLFGGVVMWQLTRKRLKHEDCAKRILETLQVVSSSKDRSSK